MSDEDKVGYGNPPKGSRFKPGESGNPSGRPKGSKNKRTQSSIDRVADIVLAEAHREIRVKENGETVSIEVMEAIIRSVAATALKGVAKSQKLMFGCCQSNANPSPASNGIRALIQPEAGAIRRGRRFSSI